jgi:hypothetical protein
MNFSFLEFQPLTWPRLFNSPRLGKASMADHYGQHAEAVLADAAGQIAGDG